jgi:hypothetical protein
VYTTVAPVLQNTSTGKLKMSDDEFGFEWSEPVTPREPKKSSRENRIPPALAKSLAAESGAAYPVSVASHLLCCTDIEDARRSIASLRRNRPEYWPEARKVPQRHIQPLRGKR